MFQSVPILKTITINGNALCTCGCGHSVSVCVDNHGIDNTNCKCQHINDKETKTIIIPNSIDNFIISENINRHKILKSRIFYDMTSKITDQVIVDIQPQPPELI